jgi:hypothetical protein
LFQLVTDGKVEKSQFFICGKWDITMRGPYIQGVKGDGIQSTTVYEFDRAKMADAMEAVSNRYVPYFGVPGFTYTINVCLEAQEALKMLGLA